MNVEIVGFGLLFCLCICFWDWLVLKNWFVWKGNMFLMVIIMVLVVFRVVI